MKNIKPYKNSSVSKKEQVTDMFDKISKDYDRANRIFSFGLDAKWRKKMIQLACNQNPTKVLDVATGTGDLAIAMSVSNATEIVGVDLSEGMLSVGHKKVKELNLENRIQLNVADSENLPFSKDYFDVILVGFGVRNFENLDKGLSEIYRVLKPKGSLFILETSVPKNRLIKWGHQLHASLVLPLVGKIFANNKNAYSYLSRSAKSFPSGIKFKDILLKNKFQQISIQPQTLGVATLYTATK